eukprot:scaffold16904_cov72-Phaeocystis_antarctica.AAC.5
MVAPIPCRLLLLGPSCSSRSHKLDMAARPPRHKNAPRSCAVVYGMGCGMMHISALNNLARWNAPRIETAECTGMRGQCQPSVVTLHSIGTSAACHSSSCPVQSWNWSVVTRDA